MVATNRKMNDKFVPFEYWRNQSELIMKVSQFQIYKDQIATEIAELETLICEQQKFCKQEYLSLKQNQKFTSELKHFISEEYAGKEDTFFKLAQQSSKHTEVQQQIKEIGEQISAVEGIIESYESIMEEKVKKAAKVMIQEVSKACSYSDLKDLYNKVVPQVEMFRQTSEQMTIEFEQVKSIVQNFDVQLAEKASKFGLQSLSSTMQKEFVQLEEYEQSLKKMREQHKQMFVQSEKLKEMIETVQQNGQQELSESLSKLARKFTLETQKLQQTKQLGGTEDLMQMLSGKADVELVDQL